MASPEIHGPHYALGFNKCFFHPPRSFGHLFFFFFFFPFVLSPCHSLFLWAFFSLSPSSVGAPCCWGFLGLPFTFGDQTITCVLQQVRIYNKGKKSGWNEVKRICGDGIGGEMKISISRRIKKVVSCWLDPLSSANNCERIWWLEYNWWFTRNRLMNKCCVGYFLLAMLQ